MHIAIVHHTGQIAQLNGAGILGRRAFQRNAMHHFQVPTVDVVGVVVGVAETAGKAGGQIGNGMMGRSQIVIGK